MNTSSNKYYAKKTENGSYNDITVLFDGLAVLKVDGLASKGKPVNIYTAQWIMEQEEDFLITLTDEHDIPIVIRENTNIEITFIIRQKYAASQIPIDVLSVHDNFIQYMTSSDLWIKSEYIGGKAVHCVCLSEYKPTTMKLERGEKSYIMGTITLHCLNEPST